MNEALMNEALMNEPSLARNPWPGIPGQESLARNNCNYCYCYYCLGVHALASCLYKYKMCMHTH